MDIIVIGNGMIASAITFRLARDAKPGDRITRIGPAARHGSASVAAAAMLNSFAEIDAQTLSSEAGLLRFELSHLATRMWPDFELEILRAAGGNLPPACRQCEGFGGRGCYGSGTYVIEQPEDIGHSPGNFDAMLSAVTQFSEPHTLLAAKDVPWWRPGFQGDKLRALYLPGEGWINPKIMLEKLDMTLGQCPNVSLIDGTATHIQCANGRISYLRLSNGESVSADRYVLANGAFMNALLATSDLALPIQPVFSAVGITVELDSPDPALTHCIRTPTRGLAGTYYAVPYFRDPEAHTSSILVGATSELRSSPALEVAHETTGNLISQVANRLNMRLSNASIKCINVGNRPTSPDTFPLLGTTSLRELTIANGTGRDGVHMAPVIAQIIAKELGFGERDRRLEIFHPERQPICT